MLSSCEFLDVSSCFPVKNSFSGYAGKSNQSYTVAAVVGTYAVERWTRLPKESKLELVRKWPANLGHSGHTLTLNTSFFLFLSVIPFHYYLVSEEKGHSTLSGFSLELNF